MEVRKEVENFAKEMEAVLKENDWKEGWENCTLSYLENKLIEEVCEYLVINNPPLEILRLMCIHLSQTVQGDMKEELADIGNVCMMLYDNLS